MKCECGKVEVKGAKLRRCKKCDVCGMEMHEFADVWYHNHKCEVTFVEVSVVMYFSVKIEKDADGKCVAEVVELPGCISDGDDVIGAIANVRDAIKGYVESLVKEVKNDGV